MDQIERYLDESTPNIWGSASILGKLHQRFIGVGKGTKDVAAREKQFSLTLPVHTRERYAHTIFQVAELMAKREYELQEAITLLETFPEIPPLDLVKEVPPAEVRLNDDIKKTPSVSGLLGKIYYTLGEHNEELGNVEVALRWFCSR